MEPSNSRRTVPTSPTRPFLLDIIIGMSFLRDSGYVFTTLRVAVLFVRSGVALEASLTTAVAEIWRL